MCDSTAVLRSGFSAKNASLPNKQYIPREWSQIQSCLQIYQGPLQIEQYLSVVFAVDTD